jgi:hypothetical protein
MLHQRDLLVGERPDFLAENNEGTERPAILDQRDVKHGANAAEFYPSDAARQPLAVAVGIHYVVYVQNLSLFDHSGHERHLIRP